EQGMVTALTCQVGADSGQVTGIYPVGQQLVDGEQKSLVDTLGSELSKEIGVSISKSATTYPRMGELVAVGIATPGTEPRQPNDDVIAVRQSLVAAHLMGVPQGSPTT